MLNIGFIVEEFFHHELRGFGGFGSSVKNISDYYNTNGHNFNIKVLLTCSLPTIQKPIIKKYHNAQVLLPSVAKQRKLLRSLNYMSLLASMGTKLFISIDYYPSYEYPLLISPTTPLMVWIRDPRSRIEWEKLASVPLELKQRNTKTKEELMGFAKEKEISIKKILRLSKIIKRKIIFVTNAHFLVERAERTYGLDGLKPYLLPNPIPLPNIKEIKYFEHPSLCFLGRLDAQKRFWMVFELAKKFKYIDFYILGCTNLPKLINPIIEKYSHIDNLKLLDLCTGQEKERILESCWGLINTSVHEGLPVSFLEAFSYGKTVISCQNPDGLVEKFGYYTGEILGEGYNHRSLKLFSEKIEEFLKNKDERIEKGKLARKYVKENHSFSIFEKQLKDILFLEKII